MASVISQLVSVVAGTLIKASVWNNEILQIVNLVSGVSTDKRMKIVCDDDTNGVLTVSQSGDGPVADFQSGGTTVMKVPVSGTPTDATDITDKAYVDAKQTGWQYIVFDGGSPTATTGDASPYPTFTPGSVGTFVITKVAFTYMDSIAGTDGDTAVFKLKRADGNDGVFSETIATVTTSKTLNGIAGATYGQLVTPNITLAQADVLMWAVDSVAAGYRLKKCTLTVFGYKTP